MAEKQTPTTATDVDTTEVATAPAKRGRKQTRDPEGKQVGAFFSKDEYSRLRKRRFADELDTDRELIHKAVLAYLDSDQA